MGKPSSSHRSKSNSSLQSSTSKEKMNASFNSKKTVQMKRKRKTRTKNNIKKLFENLRSQSTVSISDASICESPNKTVIENNIANNGISDNINVMVNGTNKRKIYFEESNQSKRRKEESLIAIKDDVVTNNTNTPSKVKILNCSTPISNKGTKSLDDLILTTYSKTLNNAKFKEDVVNLTKEINRDSYITIDLTTESDQTKNNDTTVINLDDTEETHDCTVVSVSTVSNVTTASISLSGDSDVTVLKNNVQQSKPDKEMMRRLAYGIASNLNASEKGQLLELITQKIFSGCSIPKVKSRISHLQETTSRATETAEDTYIKEVILGQSNSRNSIGSNIYHPGHSNTNSGLRMIVIDGSNVSMEHGKGKVFSVKGLKICIDYFLRRGHTVKAFLPRFRCKFGKSTDPRMLDYLERQGLVVYTPSREIQGKLITSYDDRYIVQCAAEFDAVIVSGDNYRDLHQENPRWRFVIENRLLPFTWVNDMIMFPRDPLGRNGPTLEEFLKHPQRNPPSTN